MAGFSAPERDIRSHRALATLCILVAAACIVGLLVVGFRSAPAPVLEQGQPTWFPQLDRGAR